MNPFELEKERVLVFGDAAQADQALHLLRGLEHFQVGPGPQPDSLRIRYNVRQYSLEGLQNALRREGFTFRYTFWQKIRNALFHYCEDVQYHNLKTPEPRTKNNSQEVFIKAWEQRPHGDHDTTPPEIGAAK